MSQGNDVKLNCMEPGSKASVKEVVVCVNCLVSASSRGPPRPSAAYDIWNVLSNSMINSCTSSANAVVTVQLSGASILTEVSSLDSNSHALIVLNVSSNQSRSANMWNCDIDVVM